MPYISNKAKTELMNTGYPQTPGELTYVLTSDILAYLEYSEQYQDMSFEDIAVILGCLEAAKLEFYRRVVIPYEDKKKKENGDVY